MTQLAEKTRQTLLEQNTPPEKAGAMVASVRTGLWLFGFGVLLLVLDLVGVGWAIVHLGKEPGLGLMGFAGLLLLLAIYFILAGGNVASNQALDAAGAHSPFFALAARAFRLWRKP